MRHRICLLGLLVTVVSAFGFAAPASAQTDEEVRRLIDQLDGNFQVRTRAEATLVGYIRANRLTPAQLGILRTYPERPPLELLRRKERILAQWTILFPSVGRVLDGVRFETTEVVGRDWFYRFDGFYGGAGANEDDPSHPFAARLAQRYVAARNALTAADTAQVVAALQALRTHVSDNFGQSFLYTDEGRSTRATRQQVLDRIDRAIMDAQAAIRDIQIGSNNVQPPPRRPQPIQGRGAIDVGRTLRLALLIDPVVGGGLDVFMTPWELALSGPPRATSSRATCSACSRPTRST